MDDRRLGRAELEASSVVANSAMNRERQLAGVNSYVRELGFNPVDRLTGDGRPRAWLDLCCGRGRALIQAADQVGPGVTLTGVDLVDFTDPVDPAVELICASVLEWTPAQAYDLITCVHGLHYVGDKLAGLTRAASWLTDAGLFVADLDLSSVRVDGVSPRGVVAAVRRAGFAYDTRRHRISRLGRAQITFPYAYQGADDRAGPNYTGQPAVDSYYERA